MIQASKLSQDQLRSVKCLPYAVLYPALADQLPQNIISDCCNANTIYNVILKDGREIVQRELICLKCRKSQIVLDENK